MSVASSHRVERLESISFSAYVHVAYLACVKGFVLFVSQGCMPCIKQLVPSPTLACFASIKVKLMPKCCLDNMKHFSFMSKVANLALSFLNLFPKVVCPTPITLNSSLELAYPCPRLSPSISQHTNLHQSPFIDFPKL